MKQWSRDELMKGLRELVTEITCLEKADDIDGKSGDIRKVEREIWGEKKLNSCTHCNRESILISNWLCWVHLKVVLFGN